MYIALGSLLLVLMQSASKLHALQLIESSNVSDCHQQMEDGRCHHICFLCVLCINQKARKKKIHG